MPLSPANVHRTPRRLWQRDHAKTGVFASAGRAGPFAAKHRLNQRINEGVPAGGDGWDAREAPPGLATGLTKRVGPRCLKEQDSHSAINIPGFSSQCFWFSKTCWERYANICMPPAGSVIGQSALLRENARRNFHDHLKAISTPGILGIFRIRRESGDQKRRLCANETRGDTSDDQTFACWHVRNSVSGGRGTCIRTSSCA
jgi:hypothetical protein